MKIYQRRIVCSVYAVSSVTSNHAHFEIEKIDVQLILTSNLYSADETGIAKAGRQIESITDVTPSSLDDHRPTRSSISGQGEMNIFEDEKRFSAVSKIRRVKKKRFLCLTYASAMLKLNYSDGMKNATTHTNRTRPRTYVIFPAHGRSFHLRLP